MRAGSELAVSCHLFIEFPDPHDALLGRASDVLGDTSVASKNFQDMVTRPGTLAAERAAWPLLKIVLEDLHATRRSLMTEALAEAASPPDRAPTAAPYPLEPLESRSPTFMAQTGVSPGTNKKTRIFHLPEST